MLQFSIMNKNTHMLLPGIFAISTTNPVKANLLAQACKNSHITRASKSLECNSVQCTMYTVHDESNMERNSGVLDYPFVCISADKAPNLSSSLFPSGTHLPVEQT